jgi:hypothetical protein
LTRGTHALLHGDLVTALDFNALTPAFAAAGVFAFVSLVMFAFRGRGLKVAGYRPWMLWAALVMMVVFGTLRNVPAYPLNVLYP